MRKSKTTRPITLGKGVYAMVVLPLLLLASQAVYASAVQVTFTATVSNDGGTTTDNITGQFTLETSVPFGIDVGGINGIITSGSFTSSSFGGQTADSNSAFTFVSAANRTGYGVLTLSADYGVGFFALDLASDSFFTTANASDEIQPTLSLGALRAFVPGEALGTTRFVNFIGFSDEWEGALTSLAVIDDDDGDGVVNGPDLCPGTLANAAVDAVGCSDAQVDADGDGVCDPDAESGGPSMCTGVDAFPFDPDEDTDTDGDGTGDNADTDDDNDGQSDADEQACGSDPKSDSSLSPDNDNDNSPDCVDTDDDNDGTLDVDDAFPFDPDEDTDTDGDGTGDNADTDDDNDGQSDADEQACGSDPKSDSSLSPDNDNDNSPDCVDTDDDNDGTLDVDDAFPFDPDEDTDTDGDGTGDNADTDDDNDGILDGVDPYPLVPNVAPAADNQDVNTDEDIAKGITLTASDTDGPPPLSFSVVSGPSNGSLSGTAPNLTYTPAPDYNGEDSFTFKANDGYLDSNTATVSITVNPINDAPVITSISLDTQDVQYSDAITDVIITATDIDSAPAAMSLNDDGLPATLTLSTSSESCSVENLGSTCSWTLSGVISVGAGDDAITFTANDGALNSENTATTTVSVKHEDATVIMDDDNVVAVTVDSDGSDSSVEFVLSARIHETQPDTALAGAAAAGDISNAEVTMQLVPVGPGGPVDPVPGSCSTLDNGMTLYDEELTVTCTFDDAPVNTYSLIVSVGGDYYVGSGEDAVTVYDPSLGFASGGGWFYWPNTLDKTNFGFTMKYGKNGSRVKGSLLMIRHLADGTKYRIKSNALDGLALGDSTDFGWASFTGKATYLEPGWDDAVGNYEFTTYVEDHNEPGTGVDRFWIEVRDKDRNVVEDLSVPPDADDNAILIDGGNIVVPHGKGDGGGGGKGKKN